MAVDLGQQGQAAIAFIREQQDMARDERQRQREADDRARAADDRAREEAHSMKEK